MRRITLALLISLGVQSGSIRVQVRPDTNSLAPYVPTPMDVVERMLTLARVTSKDVIYDLGCGDGRIVIAAAKKYGARGVGVDIDPQRITESITNARKADVEKLVTFKLQDALTVDLSRATVVALYLLAGSNVQLRPVLKTLKPGARIVSHNFGMGDWEPDQVDTFRDSAGTMRTLYLWWIRSQ
jgi:cyclopropane fatty-acyl-phospholipid synthase-like methyltransferase